MNHSKIVDTIKLQNAKHTTVKHCIPNKYPPPPFNNPFLPLVVLRGYGLSANKPIAIIPQIPLAPISKEE